MTPFDDELRRRLGEAVQLTSASPQALDDLRPRMRRARRIRRTLISATLVAVVASGTAAGLQIARLSHPQRAMSPGDSGDVTLPSVIATDVDVDATDSTAPTESVVTVANPTEPPVTATVPVPDTTVSSPSTTSPTSVRVESACGAVVVDVTGDATNLVRTEPSSGFEVDVKNDGPEEVEVGFADGDNECEVKAWVQNGTFHQFVDNHGQ